PIGDGAGAIILLHDDLASFHRPVVVTKKNTVACPNVPIWGAPKYLRHPTIPGMDYEFRFFSGVEFEERHRTALESDTEALERPRRYRRASPFVPYVEVRR